MTRTHVTTLEGQDISVNSVLDCTITVGAEAANVINVAIQLTGQDGADLGAVGNVVAYLSDAATGVGITAGVPDGGVAIGTDGAVLVSHVTNAMWTLNSEVDGDIDLDITDTTGTPTWYLCVILPTGETKVSDAITFA